MAHGNCGKVAWNKGLNKETDIRVKKYSDSIKKNHWSKGEIKNEICKKISKSKIGKPLSEEHKAKVGNTGNKNGMYSKKHSPESIDKMKNACKTRYKSEEYKHKFRENHWCDSNKSIKIKEKISETRGKLISEGKIVFSPNNGYKHGYYVSNKMTQSFYYRSSYELIRFNQLELDENVVEYTIHHGISLEYEINGKTKHYVPDILITYKDGHMVLEEIKGWVRDVMVFNLKCDVAKKYCNSNNIEFKIVFKEGL